MDRNQLVSREGHHQVVFAPATALEQLCSQFDGLARNQQATQRHYGKTAAQDGVQRVVAFVSLGRLGGEICLLGDGVEDLDAVRFHGRLCRLEGELEGLLCQPHREVPLSQSLALSGLSRIPLAHPQPVDDPDGRS